MTGAAKRICVYCSSRSDLGNAIEDAGRELGRFIGRSGSTLVYGGVNAGLMHIIADAAVREGAPVVGICPEVFRHRIDPVCTDIIYTADLNERKARMIGLADIFVVMPGGIGTLDEWVSTLSELKVRGYGSEQNKKIVVFNHDGIFDATLNQLHELARSPFAGPEVEQSIAVSDIDAMLATLTSLL